MKFLQKLGKSMMLPISCMPICGILMGIGYLLCPAGIQGGDIVGIAAQIGFFLIKAGGALIDNIAVLFAIGIGVGMSKDHDGVSALAAIVSWFIITVLLSPKTVTTLMPWISNDPQILMAFEKIQNPFIGILAGLIGAVCYNRFKDVQAPDYLSFFSGKRCVAIFSGLFSIIVAAILMFAWPLIFKGLINFGQWISKMGAIGAGIYGFFNRLLIPFGLHHALNNVFWFDTIGLGDLTAFWAGKTSADVGWSLGMYMSGFFPCMMFGVPGAALAIYHSAKKNRQKVVCGVLLSIVICAFLCGVTEPFEFLFMFAAPMLYLAYALLYGIFMGITAFMSFRAGFSFSAGATDLLFSASLPAAQNTWLIIPLGIAAFILFYVIFRIMITKSDLKILGREDDEQLDEADFSNDYFNIAKLILLGLGGKDNILDCDHCITRLRMEVKDFDLIDKAVIKKAGAVEVITIGEHSVQVIIGPKVQFVYSAMEAQLQGKDLSAAEQPTVITNESKKAESDNGMTLLAAVAGHVIPLKEVPDATFNQGFLGQGIGIEPVEETIVAPASGKIAAVAETKHAIYLTTDEGAELMIHCGIDTVKLEGKGFETFVVADQNVKQGDPLMTFSKAAIKAENLSDIVVFTVINSDQYGEIKIFDDCDATTADPVMRLH